MLHVLILRQLLIAEQVPGVLRTATGKPGEVICQIAEEVSAAMIITGTRSVGKMRRTILGSVSDYLVTHALCPVLVCRDPAEIERRRIASGDSPKGKSRHASGDSLTSFKNSLRQRFASGGKARAQSFASDKYEMCGKERKENRDPQQAATLEGDEEEVEIIAAEVQTEKP